MRGYYITFRSITPAQRGQSILHRAGLGCEIQRTPRWMEERGCGYCLRLPDGRVREALARLQRAGVSYRGVYFLESGQEAREVAL